jgi:hypothetical protein
MSDISTLFSNPKKRVKLDDQPRESALAPVAASDTFTTFLPEDEDSVKTGQHAVGLCCFGRKCFRNEVFA